MYDDHLVHYGVKGMKWGVRRWQYDNGRLTDGDINSSVDRVSARNYKITGNDQVAL